MLEHTPFQQLRAIWDEKLKDSGFEDIEEKNTPNSRLIRWHSHHYARINEDKINATIAYYNKAVDLLHTYKFENPTHKRIWELHSEGFPKRKIAKLIENLTPAYKRETIGNIIKLIESSLE